MQIEQCLLEIISVLVVISTLSYTAWLDWKYRRVDNSIWAYPIGVGTVILLVRTYLSFEYLLLFFLSVGVTFLLVFTLFSIGVFGGADGKALLATALVLPTTPTLIGDLQTLPIFSISLFDNMIILIAISSILLLIWNIVRSAPTYSPFEGFRKEKTWRRILTLFTCYRVSISKIKHGGRIRIRETIKDNDLYLKTFGESGSEDETSLVSLESYKKKKGLQQKVWVSSPVPLILFMLGGLIISLTAGDIILRIAYSLLA
ncbi:MAG: A24 family peptidase C-terminal domain-containing protein [Promethearchaeota archaeon]